MNITDVKEVKANPKIPALSPGDTVRVRQKVVEGEKSRIQAYQGVVIKVHNCGVATNFTVRRVSYSVGVERTFPLYSPMIDSVEIIRHGKVRRAKLYYLRGLSSRDARLKEKRIAKFGEDIKPVEPEPEVAALDAAAAAAEQKPAVAEQAPAAAAPAAEAPKAEAPKTEAPKAEAPKAQAPEAENKETK
jgi:large subunit ribosomal protein L19